MSDFILLLVDLAVKLFRLDHPDRPQDEWGDLSEEEKHEYMQRAVDDGV